MKVHRVVRRPTGRLVTNEFVDLNCVNPDSVALHAHDLLQQDKRRIRRVEVTREDGFTETYERSLL